MPLTRAVVAPLLMIALVLILSRHATAENGDAAATAMALKVVWQQDTLTGDWARLRPYLADRGLSFAFIYTNDTLGNVTGGKRRLGVVDGLFEMSLDVDLQKAWRWPGAMVHATGYQIHGHGLSARALGNLLTVSSIEATPSTRLFTLWFEQGLFERRVLFRFGQLAANEEFATSAAAALFVNSTFGWLGILGSNLPSGGPNYPLAAPAARLAIMPFENLAIMTAVFSGDPAGRGTELDPQRRNLSGTTFSFSGGTLLMSEAKLSSGEHGWIPDRPTMLKAGLWYHSGKFDDQRFDTTAHSLADPTSTGLPRRRRGNYGGYAVVDQTLWRAPEGKQKSFDAFVRFAANPSDRNLVGWYFDGGIVAHGVARSDDSFGLAFAFARIGDAARARDRDRVAFRSTGAVRDYEATMELTYLAPITAWWTVQPELQVILHPGGNVTDSRRAAGATVSNALVLGVRTTLKF